jgi:hypothetical protein
MKPTRYTIVLTAKPGNWRAPVEARLKAALKRLLRSYGLRCVACKPVAPADAGQVPTEGRR